MEYYVIERQSIPRIFSELKESGISCKQISLMTGMPIKEVISIKDGKRGFDKNNNELVKLVVNLRMDQDIDYQLLLKETVQILVTIRCMNIEMICHYLNISESELHLIVTDYQKANLQSIIAVLRLERTLSIINSINTI